MNLGTSMLWKGLEDPVADFSAPNSFHSLAQNLSQIQILVLALSTNIKRKIIQRWEVTIPQELAITNVPSQTVPTAHVFPVTISILGSRSTCFSGILQTWAEAHHNAVEDSRLGEQNNALQFGESFIERQIILGLITFGFYVFMVNDSVYSTF